ncbi:MAG: hypothetical protein QXS54_06910, partial [Candidatus Methanomethylicaceae archaeon]
MRYPLPYENAILSNRPDRRRMGDPRTRPDPRPLRTQAQAHRTPTPVSPARNRQRHPVHPRRGLPVAAAAARPPPVEDRLLSLPTVATARGLGASGAGVSHAGAASGGARAAEASCGGQPERAHHPKRGARGDDGGKKVKGRKRHIVVDSLGTILDAVVTPAEV